MKTKLISTLIIMLIVALAACQPAVTKTPGEEIQGGKLTPYATITLTPTITATPNNAPTATLAPTLTPTPRAYIVKANDTMIVIAFKNGLTVEELQAANPSINPNLMSVGLTIYIPASKGSLGTQTVVAPTPFAVTVLFPRCMTALTGGWYCFADVKNDQEFDMDNLTAEFRLSNPTTGEVVTQIALLPVSRLASGETVPFFAYFPPPVVFEPEVSLRVISAMQVDQTTPQSAGITLDPLETKISAVGSSASVSGAGVLTGEGAQIKMLRITTVAFNALGQIIGIRQLDQPADIKTGESALFTLSVYSLGGKIDRVEVYAEAIQ